MAFGVAATSSAGGVTVTITVNGIALYTGAIGGAPTSLTLVDRGPYTVAVTFTDTAATRRR